MAADKKPVQGKKAEFENAVYELGLALIEAYRKGAYNNLNPPQLILGTIAEIFKRAKTDDERG